jgi:hypothetical protein
MARSLENIPYSEFSTKAFLSLLKVGIDSVSGPTIARNEAFDNVNVGRPTGKDVKSTMSCRITAFVGAGYEDTADTMGYSQ